MTHDATFSDEDLTAFLDGETDTVLARAIEDASAVDPVLAERIAGLDISTQTLRDAFDAQLASAPAMPPLPDSISVAPVLPKSPDPATMQPKWRGFWPGLVTGLAASLAIVMITGLGTPKQNDRDWLDVVAGYQMLYVPETLNTSYSAGGPGAPGNRQSPLQEMSQLVGLDLTPLQRIDGLAFKAANRLEFDGKHLVQLAFALPDGTPVSICVLQSTAERRTLRSQTLEGMAAIDWTTGTHGIVVIGGQDQNLIDQIAPQVQSLI